MPVLLHLVNGFFRMTTAKLYSCNKDPVAHETENIYYLAIYRESSPTSDLNPAFE